jgi:PleD family two-component response regulator
MKQGPSHILAVNDHPHQLNVLASIIELAEYNVIKATSPNASIRLATEQQPDLIIIIAALRAFRISNLVTNPITCMVKRIYGLTE